MTRFPFVRFAAWWLVGWTAPAPIAHANPESLGAWMGTFGAALGLETKDLPLEGEYVDDFEAIAARPAGLTTFGFTDVTAGDRLALHNHQNGFWTITNPRTKQVKKVALVWLVRFGIVPEPELPEGEPPDHIRGRITSRAQLIALGFTTAPHASTFAFDLVDDAWVLSLMPGGEKRRIPL